jgi:hypothetical protein
MGDSAATGAVAWLRDRIAEQRHQAVRPCGQAHPEQGFHHPDGHPDPFRRSELDAFRAVLDAYEEAHAYYVDNPHAPAGEAYGLWTAIQHLAQPYNDWRDFPEVLRLDRQTCVYDVCSFCQGSIRYDGRRWMGECLCIPEVVKPPKVDIDRRDDPG